jgi:hypothetical protein
MFLKALFHSKLSTALTSSANAVNDVFFSADAATSCIDDDKVPSSLFANMSVDRGSRDGLKMDVPVEILLKLFGVGISGKIS